MAILESKVNPHSPEYTGNQERMSQLVQALRDLTQTISEGGGAKAQEKHLSRGKLLPRERVRQLLDPGSPFLELG